MTPVEFAKSMLHLMLLAVTSDGEATADELGLVRQSVTSFIGEQINSTEIDSEIDAFKTASQSYDLQSICSQINLKANETEKVVLLKLCIVVVFADSKIRKEETEFLAKLGHLLNIPQHDIDTVLDSAKKDFTENMGPLTSDREEALKVLGLEKSATQDEVRVRYKNLATRYAPEGVKHLGAKIIFEADERMRELDNAYKTLNHPSSPSD